MKKLREAGIACGALNEVEELMQHPQLRTVEYEAPSGTVELIAPPVEYTDGERTYRSVPTLGEQSEAIRLEFQEVV